jgi:hypothetical protein
MVKLRIETLLIISAILIIGIVSAAVDFPAEEAGVSVYVKAKANIPNPDVVKPAFASIERENVEKGYIIGTVAMEGHSEEEYPHVYVSADGWLVAYYPSERSSGWLLPWRYYGGGPISTTTLNEAAKKVCDQIGGSTAGLKYYDFRYSNATKMMVIVESASGSETRSFTVTIPTNFTVYRVDWANYAYISNWDASSKVTLDGQDIVKWSAADIGGTGQKYGTFDLTSQFGKGIEHKITIETNEGGGSPKGTTARIGLVLEYEDK